MHAIQLVSPDTGVRTQRAHDKPLWLYAEGGELPAKENG
jgi:hypothetical protein